MNVTLDRYHPKANKEFEEEAERDNSFIPLSWSYIKYGTRKTVYERVLFIQSSYILKEVKSINLTNLHSLCEQVNFEQVPTSSTSSAKEKLNKLKLFSKKKKLYPHNSNTDQLQYVSAS